MVINIFEVFGSIGLKDEGFASGIRDATEKGSSFGEKFGNVMAGIGKAAAVGLGAAATALGALATKALMAGGDLEQSVGGIETLFKDSADTVIANAEKAYLTAGVNANDYMQQVTSFSASLLQSLGGDTAEAARVADMAVIDMADNANKMGTSMGDIQNAYQGFAKQNYTMLDNLKLGYGGTKTEMERLLADAEKLSGTKYDISNLNDVYEAIHVVQTELGITGTTAKEGVETLTGSLATAKAAFANFLSGAGSPDALVESVGNVVEVVTDRLQELLPRLATGLTNVMQGLIPLIPPLLGELLTPLIEGASSLINGVIAALPDLVGVLVDAMPMIIDAIMTLLPLMMQAGMDIIVSLIDGLASMLPDLIPLAVETITILVQGLIDNLPLLLDAALQLISGLTEGIIAAIPILIEALPGIITGIIDFLLGAIPQIIEAGIQLLVSLVDALPEIIEAIVEAIPKIIEGIVKAVIESLPLLVEAGIKLFVALIKALPKIIVTIVEAVPKIIDSVISALIDAIPLLIEAGVELFIALIENLPTIIIEIVKAIPKIITAIVSGFTDNIPKIVEVGSSLIKGLWQGIQDVSGWLWEKISGFFGGVVDRIKDFFGIASPSKMFAGFGKNIGQGFANGVLSMADTVNGAMDDVFGGLDKTVDVTPVLGEVVPLAGSSTTAAGVNGVQGRGVSVSITNHNYINSELDIQRIGNQLARQTETALRSMGVAAV